MSSHPGACIVEAMEQGGFLDALRRRGAEAARVLHFVTSLSSGRPAASGWQNPTYPCFPGLRHRPFHDPRDHPAAALLEDAFEVILAEWRSLSDRQYVRYAPASMRNEWRVHPFWYMGEDLDVDAPSCPETSRILRSLPRVCLHYPWADALLSVHTGDSHLGAHCSIDNLRVRCHLGLQVNDACAIRVAGETRRWEEGKVLLFEDSFEHEVWNRGRSTRAILIVDLWHPDLTSAEIRALTAGFRRSAVRRQFALERLKMAHDVPESMLERLEAALALADDEPIVREYWDQ